MSAINRSDNRVTLNDKTGIAQFEIQNEAPADKRTDFAPRLISLAKCVTRIAL